jgi:hypothetical protein
VYLANIRGSILKTLESPDIDIPGDSQKKSETYIAISRFRADLSMAPNLNGGEMGEGQNTGSFHNKGDSRLENVRVIENFGEKKRHQPELLSRKPQVPLLH